jgi:hypothetical protein
MGESGHLRDQGIADEGTHFRRQRTGRRTVVAEGTVHRRGVVKGMAASAGGFIHRHGRSGVAGVAPESHGLMGLVKEALASEGNGVPCRSRVAKTACVG